MADSKPGKIMSSRLMTMKFMQRAAASSPQTTPIKSADNEPPTKRRRISDDRRTSASAEVRAMADALAAEEEKRQRAIDHQAAAAGETKWTFSHLDQSPAIRQTPMKITTVGYSTIDSSENNVPEDVAQTYTTPGRRNFGQFGKAAEEPAKTSPGDDDGSDTTSEDSDGPKTEDDGPQVDGRQSPGDEIREKRKAKRKSDKADSLRMAAQRRNKNLNINSPGRHSLNASPLSQMSNMTCHSCGKAGHLRRDCPSNGQQRGKKRQSLA